MDSVAGFFRENDSKEWERFLEQGGHWFGRRTKYLPIGVAEASYVIERAVIPDPGNTRCRVRTIARPVDGTTSKEWFLEREECDDGIRHPNDSFAKIRCITSGASITVSRRRGNGFWCEVYLRSDTSRISIAVRFSRTGLLREFEVNRECCDGAWENHFSESVRCERRTQGMVDHFFDGVPTVFELPDGVRIGLPTHVESSTTSEVLFYWKPVGGPAQFAKVTFEPSDEYPSCHHEVLPG